MTGIKKTIFFRSMRKDIVPYFTVLAVVITSTLLLWLPFLLRQQTWLGLRIPQSDFLYVYKHFDGPLYIIPAKTAYKPESISAIDRDAVLSHDTKYYAAHLPFYPLLIRIGSGIFGYLKSMIAITVASSIALALFFYFLARSLHLTKHPLLLTVVFLFLPRFLIVRSVGAPEALFMLLILSSLYFFEKKQYFVAGLLGGLSVLTKTPGILLFGAYALEFAIQFVKTRTFQWRWLFVMLIPFAFLLLCGIYYLQYGDFFAYFNSGDNVHLVSPFAVFNSGARWVGTAWLEDVLFIFFFYALAVLNLYNSKHRSFFLFSAVFFTATLFVEHRDISRYSLPLWPFACIAFERFFTSKRFLAVGLVMLFGIYLYAWNFMTQNILPITEWLPFL